MTGVPEIVGLVKVLLVKVSVVSRSTTRPEASGKSICLSAVGSTAVNVVSKVSAVVPSNTIEVNSAPAPAVIVGLVIVGAVKVLLVSV